MAAAKKVPAKQPVKAVVEDDDDDDDSDDEDDKLVDMDSDDSDDEEVDLEKVMQDATKRAKTSLQSS